VHIVRAADQRLAARQPGLDQLRYLLGIHRGPQISQA